MSKTEKEKQGTGQNPEKQDAGQNPEKIVTKYDRKVQRREEEKAKAQRDKRISRIAGIVFVVVLACIVASFPIRTWMSLNGTYIEVNGEKVTKVEYDYNYSMVSSNFINQYYTTYLYYFGIDLTGDLSNQMYSDTLTWKDYFDELTVERIGQNKAMVKEAKEAGFAYDTAEEYKEYQETLKTAAEENGTSQKEYLRQVYGPYATESRIRPYVEEAMYLIAYNDQVLEDRFTPSQEEIQEYYDGNKISYDSIDYYMLSVDAQLPTEPTELADPAEESEEGGDAAGDGAEDTPYQPSEAEIAAAMETAKKEAEAAEGKLKVEGELNANAKRASVNYLLQSWLYDEERKAGDTTVIEDSTNHRYYAVEFADRYLDHAYTANLRLVTTTEDNGQAILDEWKSGAATEESFGEICDKYKEPTVVTEGGLLEGMTASSMPEVLSEWVFDEARKSGDTAVISREDNEYTYVVYYVGPGEEEWVVSIRNLLLNQELQEYLDAFAEKVEVKDPKNNLNYLKVREAEAEAAAQENQGSESGEEGGDAGSEDGSAQDSQAEEDNTGSDE